MPLSRIVGQSHRLLRCSFPRPRFFDGHLSSNFCLSPIIINRNHSSGSETPSNSFFEKYKGKIKHMQATNPEEYDDRVKELGKRLNPKAAKKEAEAAPTNVDSKPVNIVRPSEKASAGVGMTQTKSLDSIMKTELLENKSAEEITKIWNQYHSDKDCIYTVLQDHEFLNLIEKSKECPVFVFPVRRNDGFEMILAQFDRHDVYFTPLAMFQLVREDSPPCLTLNHFTELLEDKGIVLMKGQYDDKVLSPPLALSLVQQVSIFYGKNSKLYHLVQKFNHNPEKFDYNELIESFKTLPQYDMQ